jgi:predicted hydrocarbon binding protein
MVALETFEDGVEVSGRTVLQVVEGMPESAEHKARRILADRGIEDPDPDAWYPQEVWLGTFEEIGERMGEATIRQIGRTVASNIGLDDATDLQAAVAAVDRAYEVNHRGGDAGSYEAHEEDGAVRVVCRTPHPCPFDEALVKAVAKRIEDDGVVRVEEVDDRCRADGGDACVYEVSWWSLSDG